MDECDLFVEIDRETMRDAAAEAVENAVRFAADNGFSHAHADDLCTGFVDAVTYENDED